MKRYTLAGVSFALAAVCVALVAGPFDRHIPQAAIAFLAAVLLALFGIGMLARRVGFFLAAVAVWIVSGYPLWDALPKGLVTYLLVFIFYPVALMLAGLLLDELFKKRASARLN